MVYDVIPTYIYACMPYKKAAFFNDAMHLGILLWLKSMGTIFWEFWHTHLLSWYVCINIKSVYVFRPCWFPLDYVCMRHVYGCIYSYVGSYVYLILVHNLFIPRTKRRFITTTSAGTRASHRMSHNAARHGCYFCAKIFFTFRELVQHLRVHTLEKVINNTLNPLFLAFFMSALRAKLLPHLAHLNGFSVELLAKNCRIIVRL